MLVEYVNNISTIILDIWLYVIAGIVLTFLTHRILPKKYVLRNFNRNSFFEIVKASAVGFLLGAFSFGAVPIIAYLRKKGATTANSVSMLITSVWGGWMQLAILAKYLGIYRTSLLLAFSFLSSIVVGLIFSYLEAKGSIDSPKRITRSMLAQCDCLSGDKFIHERDSDELFSLVLEVAKNLFIALLFAALMKTVFTQNDVHVWFGSNLKSLVYGLPFATIFETFEEGLGILAGVFYSMGAKLGVVFMFMMVGVVADVRELRMLDTIFGRRTASMYMLVSIPVVFILSLLLNVV